MQVVRSYLQGKTSAETTFYNLQTKRVRFAALGFSKIDFEHNAFDSAIRGIESIIYNNIVDSAILFTISVNFHADSV
ncbi:hypothetical protein AVDCRST_MAG84-3270 [uncultured Microcoleus sp.]|uniref:Uncharacterized protein n=1 Tax=uncultured Microcoleus sp. TaxID=259945 RepID=A0A6J4MGQ6_9CYAN|nr:hypothetical protein AVDCRST_MAG84-3270 [uncultured Microcoleus sp.]